MKNRNVLTKQIDFPIDIVYLWIDGSDAKFQNLKNLHLCACGRGNDKYVDATKNHIYLDNTELKYALRSVEQNAPWINHIFIITGFGQLPDWLDINNKKITIIPQESILPDDCGVIFNSCAIEACLAHIPNLSEHFLLANDDMFFNKPITPEYFFDANGRAKFRCVYRKHGHVPRDSKSIYLMHLINAAREIERAFGIDLYNYKSAHGIDPYIKSSIAECYTHPILSKVINETRRHKFRDETDIHRLLFNLYDIVHKRADIILSHAKHVGHNLILDTLYNVLHYKSIKTSTFYCHDAIVSRVLSCGAPIVCVNDSIYNNNITRIHNRLFFETKFPNESEFEK